jgi:hypothetical protein
LMLAAGRQPVRRIVKCQMHCSVSGNLAG